MNAKLVCEGACNPGRVALDAEVRASTVFYDRALPTEPGRPERQQSVHASVSPALAARLGKLQHTPHTYVTRRSFLSPEGRLGFHDIWACEACGYERVYG